jgi:hypothetical protein
VFQGKIIDTIKRLQIARICRIIEINGEATVVMTRKTANELLNEVRQVLPELNSINDGDEINTLPILIDDYIKHPVEIWVTGGYSIYPNDKGTVNVDYEGQTIFS